MCKSVNVVEVDVVVTIDIKRREVSVGVFPTRYVSCDSNKVFKVNATVVICIGGSDFRKILCVNCVNSKVGCYLDCFCIPVGSGFGVTLFCGNFRSNCILTVIYGLFGNYNTVCNVFNNIGVNGVNCVNGYIGSDVSEIGYVPIGSYFIITGFAGILGISVRFAP